MIARLKRLCVVASVAGSLGTAASIATAAPAGAQTQPDPPPVPAPSPFLQETFDRCSPDPPYGDDWLIANFFVDFVPGLPCAHCLEQAEMFRSGLNPIYSWFRPGLQLVLHCQEVTPFNANLYFAFAE